jgi:EAL domain-containing protein (putative c-di-GMP-specific phosphodiesterase class I)
MARGKLSWTLSGIPAVTEPLKGVHALNAEDIGVVFQPIVDIATGSVLAHEALVRCARPEYAPPPVLFEHAVKEEACGRLGRIIRDVAFSTCGDVSLFVNLHPAELSARWLVRPDDPIGFQIRPVYLEITESATFTHYDLCRSVLKELCTRTGALLVVDDFGAGYSNLERLAQLEPAVVKLDIAMIQDIHCQPRKQIVTRHMVNLCRELGARVVAEGIEKLDELKCVRDLGVDLAQGYLLARPARTPPIPEWPLPFVMPSQARSPGTGSERSVRTSMPYSSSGTLAAAPLESSSAVLGRLGTTRKSAPPRKSVPPRRSGPPKKR